MTNKQNGYSLIEIIAGSAIGEILAVGLTTLAFLTINVMDDTKGSMNSMMQLENAGYWLSRDIQMSDNLTLGENAGFPLQLM